MKLKCTCKHEGQDNLHGSQVRVHNKTLKSKALNKKTYRCSVCGNERTVE